MMMMVTMMQRAELSLIFLLISALCSVCVDGSGAGGDAVFVNPPPAINWYGHDPSFASDVVWTLGDVQVIQWNTTFPQFNIEFWQQTGPNSAKKAANIFSGTTEREFKWVVQNFGYSLDFSNVFFFYIFNPDNPSNVLYTSSGYLNLTESKAGASPPPATTKLPAASKTSSLNAKTTQPASTSASSSSPVGDHPPAFTYSSHSTAPTSSQDSSTTSQSSTSSGGPSSASASTSPSSPSSPSSTDQSSTPPLTNDVHSASSTSLSTGAKAGIAIGAIGLVAIAGLLGAILLAFLRKGRGGATAIPNGSESDQEESWYKANAWIAGQPSMSPPTELDSLRDPAELEHERKPPVELAGRQYAWSR